MSSSSSSLTMSLGRVSSLVMVGPCAGPPGLGLQVTVHQVDLLDASQTLADVLRADLPHALHRLQLRIGGGRGGDPREGHPRGSPPRMSFARMSFARISPTPSTDSSSGSVAARISSSP